MGFEVENDGLEVMGLEDGGGVLPSRMVMDSTFSPALGVGWSSSMSESSLPKMGFRFAGGGRVANEGFLGTLSPMDNFDMVTVSVCFV